MAPTAWMVHAPDYTSPGTFEKRMAVRAEHLVGFKQLIAAGTVVLGGFMIAPESALPGVQEADRKLVGSAFIVHAEKIEDVRAFIEVDPYWKNDVWDKERLSILPFIQVVGPTLGG